MHDPRVHRCGLSTLDYARVEEGHIECVECGREYYFVAGKGWFSNPWAKHVVFPPRIEMGGAPP